MPTTAKALKPWLPVENDTEGIVRPERNAAKLLLPVLVGDKMQMKLPGQEVWSRRTYIKYIDHWSLIVEVKRKHY